MSLAEELLADLDEIDNENLGDKLSGVNEDPIEIEVDDTKESNFEPFDVESPVSITS